MVVEIFNFSSIDKDNRITYDDNGLGKSIKPVKKFRKRHGIGNWHERNKKEKFYFLLKFSS